MATKKKTTTKKVTAPKVPGQFNWNIYGGTISAMNALKDQYANTKFNYKPNYTPGTFAYKNAPGRETYDAAANQRVQSELAAKQAAMQANVANARGNYQMAQQAANTEQSQAEAGINRQAELDAGRLSNMLANSGVAGQGAAQEMYGLRGVASQQIADNAVKYGLQRQQAANQLSQNLSGYQAEVEAARAGSAAQAQQYADAAYQQGFQNYMAERGQAFNEFGQSEQSRQWAEQAAYQNALDSYNSYVNSLNNQMGVLGSTAALTGQQYQNAYQDIWNRYNAQYGQYQDYTQLASQNAMNNQQYNMYMANLASTNAAQSQAYNLANAQLNAANQMPAVYWRTNADGSMTQMRWDASKNQYVEM